MRPRDRVLTALAHQEPDQVPLDIGGSDVTGIHLNAYRQLLPYIGFKAPEYIPVVDTVQQLSLIDEAVLRRLKSHCRGVFPEASSTWSLSIQEDKRSSWFKDEWGITWSKPKDGGLYYDMIDHPLSTGTLADLETYPWPDPADPARQTGLENILSRLHNEAEYAVILSGITGGGPMEVSAWLAGFDNFFAALLIDPDFADGLLDKVLEAKLGFWQSVLPKVGRNVDIISESEDLGIQDRLMVSPWAFRQHIKPRLKQLCSGIKAAAPHVKILLHSDGAIAGILEDLIETGVDILNPVQVSAKGMQDTAFLKREFGKDLVFWGGIDTQFVLSFGTPQQVKDEVKRRIEDLAPGGGYVLASVHNIQAGVPPTNILAMLDAWEEYGKR